MEHLPLHIGILFALTTILTIALFYLASGKSKIGLFILLGWIAIQGLVAYSGFYTLTDSIPPRFILAILPPLLSILVFFFTQKGRLFIDRLDSGYLTLLHIVRIPVEIGLSLLFAHAVVPELMTYHGRNFDIFSGITAPFIFYFGYIKHKIPRGIIIIWNFICLALLLNIVANGILSVPSPFQKFAFEQPNLALLHFPFLWLPCCIVPLVLFAHLVCLRELIFVSKATIN
jgi:hypothetical protein